MWALSTKIYKFTKLYERHIKNHENPEVCHSQECGKQCQSKIDLNRHIKQAHNSNNICSVCEKKFVGMTFIFSLEFHLSTKPTSSLLMHHK